MTFFSFLQDVADCSPHYLWEDLKSRYNRMNVCLSVCVMGLIMVSYVLHNEPHPHRKALFAVALTSSTFFSSLLLCGVSGSVAHINSGGRDSKNLFRKVLFQVFQAFVCTLICRCLTPSNTHTQRFSFC